MMKYIYFIAYFLLIEFLHVLPLNYLELSEELVLQVWSLLLRKKLLSQT